MMTNTQPKETTQASQLTPGQMLRRAREEQELSITDIATRLRLDQKIIQALEENDYTSLPAATYVRGYLRAYAKAVNLDSNELINLYDSEAPEPPEILPEVKHRAQISSSDKPVKAVTYLITLGLVLLLLIWWQSHFVMDKGPASESTDTSGTAGDETSPKSWGFDYDYTIVTHPDDWRSGYGTENENTSTADQDNGETDSQLEDMATIDQLEVRLSATPEELAEAPVQDTIDITATGPSGSDRIAMQLSGDCWIEIYDATDTRIYMNLAKTGQHLQVNGTAPFRVVLGNAAAVQMEFNGTSFDTEPFTIAGVARFTLGE